MSALNLLAVQNAAMLRAFRDRDLHEFTGHSGLAALLKRDASNVAKSVKVLQAEGLLTATPYDADKPALTPQGQTQLAAIDRAEGHWTASGREVPAGADERGQHHADEPGSPPTAPASGMLALYHAQILPDPGNARRDWDSEEARAELDALREDLLLNGLLQNLVVRPVPADDLQGVTIERTDAGGERHVLPLYRLVGGERRWRAIAIAISDGDWPEDRLIPCRELDADDLGCRLAALAENIQRRNLNPIEKARAFEGLAEAGLTNQQIAERIVATPEHVQQHRRFLQLDDADQQRMTLAKDDPRHLSVRDARQKLARKEEAEPKPIELTAPQRLAAAELVHAVRARASYTYNDIAVAAEARQTSEGQALAEAGIARFAEAPRNWGEIAGHFTVCLCYNNPAFGLFPWAMAAEADERDAGLKAEQELAGRGPGEGYATAWLNEPFELTPEGQEIHERVAAEVAAAATARAEREAEEAARKARWAAARQRHIALFAEAVAKPVWGVPEQTVEIAAAIDRPLPWSVTAAGKVLDANGREVTTFGHWQGCSDQGLVTARMIVAAVNAAGGLATPATPEPAVEGDDEPEQDINGDDPDTIDAETVDGDDDDVEDAA